MQYVLNTSPTSYRCCECLRCCGRRDPRPRTVWLGHPEKRDQRYPRNVINNQKYNFFTFLPGVCMPCWKTMCFPLLLIFECWVPVVYLEWAIKAAVTWIGSIYSSAFTWSLILLLPVYAPISHPVKKLLRNVPVQHNWMEGREGAEIGTFPISVLFPCDICINGHTVLSV